MDEEQKDYQAILTQIKKFGEYSDDNMVMWSQIIQTKAQEEGKRPIDIALALLTDFGPEARRYAIEHRQGEKDV